MITDKGLIQLGFKPEIDFVLRDNSDGNGVYMYEWNSSSPQPTVAEIESAYAEWQAEYDSQEYARNRQAEYPSLDDLIVALWEGVVEERMASVTQLEAERQAVKARHPKV